jgi:hypothetical protein
MVCSRDTANPPALITASTSSGIHSHLKSPKIVGLLAIATSGTMLRHVRQDRKRAAPRGRSLVVEE